MRDVFVTTENARRLMHAMSDIERRGALEACIVVIDGQPGLGKTTITTRLASQSPALFIRAKKEWTPNWMLDELLEAAGVQIRPASFQKRFNMLLDVLSGLAKSAQDTGEMFFVGIDEADYICKSDKMLSTLRDLSDFLETPFVLVGMGKVRDNLNRFPQVVSRVGRFVRFKLLSLEDTGALVSGLCEAEVSPELIDLIHHHSGGYAREIKEAIASIERVAARSGGSAIGVAEMAGQVLLNNRRTSTPIIVQEAL